MQSLLPEKRTCKFVLTKGKRNKQLCGRPVWKKGGETIAYCLAHVRLLANKSADMVLESGSAWPYLQINKPEETPRTILEPILEEESVKEEEMKLEEEAPKEDDMTSILNLLDQVRRNIKTEKK